MTWTLRMMHCGDNGFCYISLKSMFSLFVCFFKQSVHLTSTQIPTLFFLQWISWKFSLVLLYLLGLFGVYPYLPITQEAWPICDHEQNLPLSTLPVASTLSGFPSSLSSCIVSQNSVVLFSKPVRLWVSITILVIQEAETRI